MAFAVFPEEVRLMLRESGLKPDDSWPALSAEAQLLLRTDHDRGLHRVPEPDCDRCAAADALNLAAGGMEPATPDG